MSKPEEWCPKKCPQCGGEAWFQYETAEECARQSPLCFGNSDRDCRGYATWKAKMAELEVEK